MRINSEKNFLFGEKVSNMGQYATITTVSISAARESSNGSKKNGNR